jgi:hypothetical protein
MIKKSQMHIFICLQMAENVYVTDLNYEINPQEND